MRLYWNEFSEEPTILDYTQKDSWVSKTVHAAEEEDLDGAHQTVHFEFRKNQDLLFMKGRMGLEMGFACSRCAKSIKQDINGKFEAIFTREKGLENTDSLSHGVAYSDHSHAADGEPDIQYLEKDYIELEDVLKEQIYLALPIQPLCKEDCKGICPVCGQDQNIEPCQCHRIKNTAMANALKAFKTKLTKT